jgi:3-oxoacyl-[acyl-carrier protein] reductase
MRLSGSVALVTGASRGIGNAVAQAFAREGASVFLVGHSDSDALQRAVEETRQAGAQAGEAAADGGLFDVGRYEEVRRLADAIERRFGRLDIVVNNAGVIRPTPLLEITPEQWDDTIRTHLHGTFHCTVEMVNRFMKQRRSGKIVNVAAASALRAYAGVADYASAKGGIVAFTRNAARELQPFNVQVNAIIPVARTRMIDALGAYYEKTHGARAASHITEVAQPHALVPSFLFFASSDSDYVTGQILSADGGSTL